MATASVIKIMLSSRCCDRFPLSQPGSRTLSAIRVDLQKSIEAEWPFGERTFEVWINEDNIGDGGQAAWDHCMDQAVDCDIFICLFNGNAGWADKSGTIGICHAEFEKAYTVAPGKVFIVNVLEKDNARAPMGDTNLRFQEYVERLRQFDTRNIVSEAALVAKVRQTVSQATVKLAQRGVRDASLGTNYVGAPLDWSRLNYSKRAEAMRTAALTALKQGNSRARADGNYIGRKITGKDVLFMVSAVPDAMSVAAAREVVGQPHLSDHTADKRLSKFAAGPVHIVVCHKGTTESQARAMLGFPDATVVSAPFGIYIADPVQSIQIVLIAQCRDATSTQIGVQRFLEWLDAAEQADDLVRQATKRKSVVKALAA